MLCYFSQNRVIEGKVQLLELFSADLLEGRSNLNKRDSVMIGWEVRFILGQEKAPLRYSCHPIAVLLIIMYVGVLIIIIILVNTVAESASTCKYIIVAPAVLDRTRLER